MIGGERRGKGTPPPGRPRESRESAGDGREGKDPSADPAVRGHGQPEGIFPLLDPDRGHPSGPCAGVCRNLRLQEVGQAAPQGFRLDQGQVGRVEAFQELAEEVDTLVLLVRTFHHSAHLFRSDGHLSDRLGRDISSFPSRRHS